MTQLLHFPRRVPRGWYALAQVLRAAPEKRRPEFAMTEPLIFRSEAFAEDLPHFAETQRAMPRRAGLLTVAPLAVAAVGVIAAVLGQGA